MTLVVIFLASYFTAIDTTIVLGYWPSKYPWIDLMSFSAHDDGYEIQIRSTPQTSCSSDTVFGPCANGESARYRYISVIATDSSKRLSFLQNQSLGDPPETPIGALFTDTINSSSSWTQVYSIRDREYKFAMLEKTEYPQTWRASGDSIFLKWSAIGDANHSFRMESHLIHPTVKTIPRSKQPEHNRHEKPVKSIRLNDSRLHPTILDNFDLAGKRGLQ